MTRLDEAAHEFAGFLESRGIPYAIMGGFAVRIHALPRPTFDVDFTISLPREALTELYERLEELGYTIPESQRAGWIDTVRELPVVKFQVIQDERSIDVDVFLAETTFLRKLLERRQRHAANGWSAWFVTAEDLILLKLLADRPKDRIDVADILFIQGTLDRVYLREWAGQLKVVERLESALANADAAPSGPTP